eukprot:3040514-Ditylum_brightwellii.AAC.1
MRSDKSGWATRRWSRSKTPSPRVAVTKAVVTSLTASLESKLDVYLVLPFVDSSTNQETLQRAADGSLRLFGEEVQFQPEQARMVFLKKTGKPSVPIDYNKFIMILHSAPSVIDQEVVLTPEDRQWFQWISVVAEHKPS